MGRRRNREPTQPTNVEEPPVVELELAQTSPHSLPEGTVPEHLRHGSNIVLRNKDGELVDVFIQGLE